MIKVRRDLNFIFLTKRIERFASCAPPDWDDGYDNVTVGCTVEDQATADIRLSIFAKLPIKHRNIILQPLLERVNIEQYLYGIDLVVLGGESDINARPLDYEWVLSVREQCIRQNVSFVFRQCGTHFIKHGEKHTLPTRKLISEAAKASVNYEAMSMVNIP